MTIIITTVTPSKLKMAAKTNDYFTHTCSENVPLRFNYQGGRKNVWPPVALHVNNYFYRLHTHNEAISRQFIGKQLSGIL